MQSSNDANTKNILTSSEVEKRRQHLDNMTGVQVLKPLVEECLNNNPDMRPVITNVCKQIQISKDAYTNKISKRCHHSVSAKCTVKWWQCTEEVGKWTTTKRKQSNKCYSCKTKSYYNQMVHTVMINMHALTF